MPIFDTLLDLDDALVDWILHASPTNDDERAQMKQIFALRAELDQTLNALVAFRMKLAVANLGADSARLSAASDAIKGAAKSIDTVQSVFTAAGTAVSIAAKALSFVGG